MPPALRPERVTQNRVVACITSPASAGGMGYTNLGEWCQREGNRCVEAEYLRANPQKRGYADAYISQALHRLTSAMDATDLTPYQANLRTYQLLRYGVPVQVAAGAPHETVHLIDWANPAQNAFALAEEVTLTRTEVARAYAISKLGWIRLLQQALRDQARESKRRYIERESHGLWGRNHLLTVIEADAKPAVKLDHRRITLSVRPGSRAAKRAEVMHEWHKRLLHAVVPDMIARWEPRLGVKVAGYFLQRVKTRWGSCNHVAGNIRLNTELVKKPKDLVEYVVVHEMLHLLEPTHNERFVALLTRHWPQWHESRMELNALPLRCEAWPEIATAP